MKYISEPKRFVFAGGSWLIRLFGLGVVGLVIGYLMGVWGLPARDTLWTEVSGPAQTAAADVTPVDSGRAKPVAAMTFRQVLKAGSVRRDERRSPLTDAYGEPLFRPWQARRFTMNPTFPFFGYAVKMFGGLWLIEGQGRYVAIHLEISLSTPSE